MVLKSWRDVNQRGQGHTQTQARKDRITLLKLDASCHHDDNFSLTVTVQRLHLPGEQGGLVTLH